MKANTRYSLSVIRKWEGKEASGRGQEVPGASRFPLPASRSADIHSSFILHPSSFSSPAFTLVEVALAIAVVAIGLVGVLALFPLGLRATRGAMDDTQMALIAQDYITYYQHLSLATNNYATSGGGLIGGSGGTTYSNTVTNDAIVYTVRLKEVNSDAEFAQLYDSTYNYLTRVYIDIWRPGSKTNTYVTEVARYVRP